MTRTEQQDMDRLNKAADALGEFFDTVQIVVTRHDPTVEGGTVLAHSGSGNYYGRIGSVRAFLLKMDDEDEAYD